MFGLLPVLVLSNAPDVRLYVLDGGWGRINDSSLFSDTLDAGHRPIDLADPCFLIKHGHKWLLWDTGLTDGLVSHPQRTPAFSFRKARTLTAQLKELGLNPKMIDYVSLSHCHFDHTGNFNLFGSATWIVERSELQYGHEDPAPFSVDSSLLKHSGKRIEIVGDYDVFGDGTVRILSTPGHTPGHASLLVRLAHAGPVLLSGDLFHSRKGYENGWVPPINASRAETLASIARLKAIEHNLRAKLIIQHNPGDYAALPKAPKYVD